LQAEGISRSHLVGQSYSRMLAQAYLARHPQAVDRLVLSSTGPADFGLSWLPAAYLIAVLLRMLPEPGSAQLASGKPRSFSTRTVTRRSATGSTLTPNRTRSPPWRCACSPP